ncbi:hypothetical protein [Inquilinus limosus]|uniref:hypothetical protein n=1 Tax=Inquilinus limosus TaxID=171674 RepID=UPI0003F6B4D3|nr:hypothetical protein [Inquilinus limosus]
MSPRRLTWDQGFDAGPDAPAPSPVEEAAERRLHQAWEDGYAAGRAAGRADAAAAEEARCAEALERLLQAIGHEAEGLRSTLDDVAAAGARAVVQALQALLPAFSPRFAAIQAESLIEEAILAAAGKPTLLIAAAPDLHPILARRLADRAAPATPAITVDADEGLAPGTVTARWDGGGAHWSAAGTARRIEAVLDRLLKDLDHDRAD